MKITLFLFSLLVCASVFSQKNGEYLTSEHPANNLWEFDGNKDNAAPIFAEMAQQFFFLVPDGSEKSMMAPFYMEGMGFACPTYFQVSTEKDFLYLDIIGEACVLDVPEEELHIKLKYKVEGANLILIIDGMEYSYREWGSESTSIPKDAPIKMSADREKAIELLSMGGWHPASRGEFLFKGIYSIKLQGEDENGYRLLQIKGVGEEEKMFELVIRAEIDADNDYTTIEIHEEDQSKLCDRIYCYFADKNNASFLFTNSWFAPEDEELKDQNWMKSRR